MSVYSWTASISRRGHHLGDDRQAGFVTRLARISSPRLPEPAKLVGRGARLVGAAAQHLRAGRLDRPGRGQRLLLDLDRAGPGDDRHLVAADLNVAHPDRRLLRVEIPAAELVSSWSRGRPARRRGRPRASPRASAERRSDYADDGALLAFGEVRAETDLLDPRRRLRRSGLLRQLCSMTTIIALISTRLLTASMLKRHRHRICPFWPQFARAFEVNVPDLGCGAGRVDVEHDPHALLQRTGTAISCAHNRGTSVQPMLAGGQRRERGSQIRRGSEDQRWRHHPGPDH